VFGLVSENFDRNCDAFDLPSHHSLDLDLHLNCIANPHDLSITSSKLRILIILLPRLPKFIFVLKFQLWRFIQLILCVWFPYTLNRLDEFLFDIIHILTVLQIFKKRHVYPVLEAIFEVLLPDILVSLWDPLQVKGHKKIAFNWVSLDVRFLQNFIAQLLFKSLDRLLWHNAKEFDFQNEWCLHSYDIVD